MIAFQTALGIRWVQSQPQGADDDLILRLFGTGVRGMDHEQVLAKYSATGFNERMVEDFALWLNEDHPNKTSSGYYVREGDGFRYLEGETPEIQDGRMKAFEEAEDGTRAVARFGLGVYAERVEADHEADDQLEVSSLFILLPQKDL